jgi:2-amino-4-hydroxy-6-hydroxymethyldihydropteridine diphosphokinase
MTAYIGLGSNLGDSAHILRDAARALAGAPHVVSCVTSPFYRSAPVDADGPDFVNAVARLRTSLPPLALLDLLQDIEQRHGRTRPYRHAPRTLDLDLLLYEDIEMDSPRLTLPHPGMASRAFVLMPLRDLAPGLMLAGVSLDRLLDRCGDQTLERLDG